MNKYYEENDFDFINAIAEALPTEAIKIIDSKRYETMLLAAMELETLLAETQKSGEIQVDVDDMFNLGYISTIIPDLHVLDIQRFISVISKADNFEIYPLTNGKIRLDITFQAMLKTIG